MDFFGLIMYDKWKTERFHEMLYTENEPVSELTGMGIKYTYIKYYINDSYILYVCP